MENECFYILRAESVALELKNQRMLFYFLLVACSNNRRSLA
jgi:hypothetical protein